MAENTSKTCEACGEAYTDKYATHLEGCKARAKPIEPIKDGELEIKRFVFNEDKVMRQGTFPAGEIDGLHFVGVLLPRNKDIYDKDGNFVKTTQIEYPALITSDRQLLPIGTELENKYRIRFKIIPAEYPLRWKLLSIYDYLQGKTAPPSGKKIFDTIRYQYEKYLYFASPEWYDIRALWDMGTYFFMLFYYYPLAELRGMKGTAKTKIFAISRGFTFNATEEMTNPSEATLFHETAERRPTKYIDEAEKLFTIQNGKVMSDPRADLLNASYKYTGTVPRMEKVGNKFVKISYSVYSPGMIGSINGLFGATEDRALVQTTTKAPKGDLRANIEPNPNDKVFEETRNQLYIYALTASPSVKEIYNTLEIEGLEARELFLWKPILAIAKAIDGELFKRVLAFAKQEAVIKSLDSIAEDSQEWRLLTLAMEILKSDDKVLIREIVNRWKIRFGEAYAPHNKTVSGQMDRFGFRSYKEHFEDGNGYRIPKSLFAQVVQSISPNLYSVNSAIFASFASAASATRDKTKQTGLKETEENEEKEKKESANGSCRTEGNEANEATEDGSSGRGS